MFKKNMEDEVVTSQRIGETAEDSCTKLWQGINLVMMIFFLLSTYVQVHHYMYSLLYLFKGYTTDSKYEHVCVNKKCYDT